MNKKPFRMMPVFLLLFGASGALIYTSITFSNDKDHESVPPAETMTIVDDVAPKDDLRPLINRARKHRARTDKLSKLLSQRTHDEAVKDIANRFAIQEKENSFDEVQQDSKEESMTQIAAQKRDVASKLLAETDPEQRKKLEQYSEILDTIEQSLK